MEATKFETRNTVVKAKGIWGDVHCSVGYYNDEPNTISFSQHKKDENGNHEYHNLTLYKDDLRSLVSMLRENEMI